MFDRRSILSGTSASLIAGAFNAYHAKADEVVDVRIDPNSLSPEYIKRHTVRFPKLDEDSYMNFIEGAKQWHSRTQGGQWTKHTEGFLKTKGTTMIDDTALEHEAAFKTMLEDPVFAARVRVQWTLQDLMWDRAVKFFHRNAEVYYAAMEATDKTDPGSLELNPDLAMPEYTLHEIHRQPGGYVGDPFGGWVYHWSLSQAFYQGKRYDEVHVALAQSHEQPEDNTVNRILDIGCSSGMTTTAYKERFPNAEVWGVDVGGPMVRYAHHRAVKMGLDCHFRQALAEDTKFPDNHFDMVHDFFLFHEVSREGAEKIVKEMFRVMRPGGSWKHNDIPTEGNPSNRPSKTILGKAAAWNSLRGNYEPWWLECMNADFPGMLRNAGFIVELGAPGPGGVYGQGKVVAIKPA